GGGETLLTLPIQVKRGMKANDVAKLIADALNQARVTRSTSRSQYILAVQGGNGGSLQSDPLSPRVAVSMTLDDGQSIADPKSEAAAAAVLLDSSTQSFSDQAVVAAEVTGIRNQFGVLGQDPLTGWLTPFKVIFSTDNPATGYAAA